MVTLKVSTEHNPLNTVQILKPTDIRRTAHFTTQVSTEPAAHFILKPITRQITAHSTGHVTTVQRTIR